MTVALLVVGLVAAFCSGAAFGVWWGGFPHITHIDYTESPYNEDEVPLIPAMDEEDVWANPV